MECLCVKNWSSVVWVREALYSCEGSSTGMILVLNLSVAAAYLIVNGMAFLFPSRKGTNSDL